MKLLAPAKSASRRKRFRRESGGEPRGFLRAAGHVFAFFSLQFGARVNFISNQRMEKAVPDVPGTTLFYSRGARTEFSN